VGLGVIVVFGADWRHQFLEASPITAQDEFLAQPLPCVEVLGRSMVERTVEQFFRADVEVVTVVAPPSMAHCMPPLQKKFSGARLRWVSDISAGVTRTLKEYSRSGIEYSFLVSGDLYVETDLLDLFFFHREGMRPATRAIDKERPLNLWVVDCARASLSDLEILLTGRNVVSYTIGGYVRRLEDPRDLRKLIVDALAGRCSVRPGGREIRPGIWIDKGAEVDKRARIVSPAYIGRNCKVKEDALITRCSSIEHNCCVDYGTVIEDSSVLANTSIGIWLDVRHAVADGNKLFSLAHGVGVEVSDPSVMRSNVLARHASKHGLQVMPQQQEEPLVSMAVQKNPTPKPEWQLGANPIQG
jgi:NDP-sugar pyrophosphorylase family protein